jgi:predicted AAA+ superfamily ATPase
VKKPDFPLRAYQDFQAFKLFILDVGLLGAMSKLSDKILLKGDSLFEEFKGALTEQYVLQQLITNPDNDIFYWAADNSSAELDFLVQNDDKIIPIEVKAEENLQAKSLRIFYNKYNPERAVRTSMSDYREQEWMVNVPLYNIGGLIKID